MLRQHHVVLLGELHGTQQAPALVTALACHALRAGLPVVVGLEVPRSEQPRLDTYLASDGSAVARTALLDSPHFWRAQVHDGRSSQAMLGVVESLRRLMRQGRPIRLVAIDQSAFGDNAVDRDLALAQAVRAQAERSPRAVVIALTGNIHNMRRFPGPASNLPTSMAMHLADLPLISLNLDFNGGQAWNCAGDHCGAHLVWPQPGRRLPWAIRLGAHGAGQFHDGTVQLGRASPSPPAAANPTR